MSGTYSSFKYTSATGNQIIDGVMSDYAWDETSITYAFPSSSIYYSYSTYDYGFYSVSTTQENAVRWALDTSYGNSANDGFSVEGFTNLSVSSGSSLTSEIRFAETGAIGTAAGYYPGSAAQSGDVWFGNSHDYRSPDAGNYEWHTLVHELGHALGLKHGHDTSGHGATTSAYESMEYSIMSYRSYAGQSTGGGYINETYGFAQTYMISDIAALQAMYGADYTTNSGDTVYSWDPSSGDTLVNGVVGIDAGGNRIFATIWDGGGVDTYDLSAYSTDLEIDLTPGNYSKFSDTQTAHLGSSHYAGGNIYNALQFNGGVGSLIENAIGGGGDDSITGNIADNTLTGGDGADTLTGGDGDDRLYGGSGNDSIYCDNGDDYVRVSGGIERFYGGAGTDYISYYSSSNGVTLNLELNTASGSWASNDIVNGFEGASGSKTGNDHITGTSGANKIQTYGGNDKVYDGLGEDTIKLGDGDDYVKVGGGLDTFDGGDGIDYISYYSSSNGVTLNLELNTASGSWASNDTIKNFESASGSKTGNDHITGTSGANKIQTYGGNDKVYDGLGNDTVKLGDDDDYVKVGGGVDNFDGGDGKDYISYYDSTNGVRIDLEADTAAWSWASNDTISNFESVSGSKTGDDKLFGTSGENRIKGNGGNDRLYGRSGDDQLLGGSGDDYFDGGAGADTLTGGSGDDVFHFDFGEDHDTIVDFENNIDTIELDNSGFADVAEAMTYATQIGTNVVFDFGSGDMLTVEGTSIAALLNDVAIV